MQKSVSQNFNILIRSIPLIAILFMYYAPIAFKRGLNVRRCHFINDQYMQNLRHAFLAVSL